MQRGGGDIDHAIDGQVHIEVGAFGRGHPAERIEQGLCGGAIRGRGRKEAVAAQAHAVERGGHAGIARHQEEAGEGVGGAARKVGATRGQSAELAHLTRRQTVGLRGKIGRNPHDALHRVGGCGVDHEDCARRQEGEGPSQGAVGRCARGHPPQQEGKRAHCRDVAQSRGTEGRRTGTEDRKRGINGRMCEVDSQMTGALDRKGPTARRPHGTHRREDGRNEAAHQAFRNFRHAQSSRLRSSTNTNPRASARSRRAGTSAV